MLFLKESLNLKLEIKNSTGSIFTRQTQISTWFCFYSHMSTYLTPTKSMRHFLFFMNRTKRKKNLIGLNGSAQAPSLLSSFSNDCSSKSLCGRGSQFGELEEEKKTRRSKLLWGRKIVTVRKSQCDLVFCHLPSGSLYTKHVAIERDGERERRTESL